MNAGPVVAAHVGGGNRRQYDIVGDTVNLGARLCSQAGKGEIVLSEAMLAKLTTQAETESMGAVALKGLDEPVPLVKVVVDPSNARGALSRLRRTYLRDRSNQAVYVRKMPAAPAA